MDREALTDKLAAAIERGDNEMANVIYELMMVTK